LKKTLSTKNRSTQENNATTYSHSLC